MQVRLQFGGGEKVAASLHPKDAPKRQQQEVVIYLPLWVKHQLVRLPLDLPDRSLGFFFCMSSGEEEGTKKERERGGRRPRRERRERDQRKRERKRSSSFPPPPPQLLFGAANVKERGLSFLPQEERPWKP